jgi:hypothetical protein
MVDGIPLALELAATWLDTLPLPTVVEQIENNLDMLAENVGDIPIRHRSMPAVLNGAWQRLSPSAQQLLAALSIFRGSFSYEAAEAITEATPHLLAQLVSHALLKFDPKNERYQLHELVHQYAVEKLSPDQNVILHRRHLGYFAGMADEMYKQWRDTEKVVGASRWEVEFGNIKAALDWAVEDSRCIVDGLKLAGGLYDFWWFQGHLAEGHHWLTTLHRKKPSGMPLRTEAIALHTLGRVQHLLKRDYASGIAYCRQSLGAYNQLADDQGRIRVFCSLGQIERHHYHLDAAERYYQQALDLARKSGDLWGQSTALHGLGAAALQRHKLDTAHAYLSEGLSCAKQLGNKERIVHHYLALGMIAMEKQQWARARSMCEQALQLHRELGNQTGEHSALTLFGEIARLEKDYEWASRLYRESLDLARDQGAPWNISIALFNLGQTDLMRGKIDHARTHLLEGFMLARRLEDTVLLGIFLDAFANLFANQDQAQHAALLWGAAEAAREANDDDFDIADRLQHEYFAAMAQAAIDETVFQDAWSAGRRMTLEDAAVLALNYIGR